MAEQRSADAPLPPASLLHRNPNQTRRPISHSPSSITDAGPDAPESACAKLSKEEMKARAVKIIVGRGRSTDDSWRSGEPPVAGFEANNEDIHEAKVVAQEIFEQHRGDIRMVSETAQLMQEEGIARILADQLDYDLLHAEAFAIGEEARDVYREYKGKPRKGKPADQRLKDAASTAKSKARAAAAKDVTLLAGLEEKLADIDAVLATDRRMLARAVPRLSWPARNTVVAPVPAPRPVPPASRLVTLRKAVAQAEERAAELEAHYVATKRVATRYKEVLDELAADRRQTIDWYLKIKLHQVREAVRETWEAELEEKQQRIAEFMTTYRGLCDDRDECHDEWQDALAAVEDARDAVRAEECAQAREREREVAAAAAAEAEAEVATEAEAAAVASMTLQAQLAELAELRAWLAEQQRAGCSWPPERAWGADWQTPPAECKVISLVEASPAQMRSLAAERGVAEVDRSRILVGRLGAPDVMAPEV